MQNLIYFFIAISLSMDAFSVALSLGTLNPNKRTIIKTSLSVGIFHFLMPIFGSFFGKIISQKININANYITALIFVILAIEMYCNKNDETKINILNIMSIIIVSISVSIDSLSVGLAVSLIENNIMIPSIIFSITSSLFTLIGLIVGKKVKNKYNKIANYLGIIILLLLTIKYIFL